ncbi:MAG: hypothetical protein K2N31_04240 [Treponemataceae bacterium]|nr:hypothetical protein [Treponemataceae bacterium]
MKKLVFVVLILSAVFGTVFAQTFTFTPMTFDSYKLHKGSSTVVEVSAVPNWSPSKKPYDVRLMNSTVGSSTTEDNNWVNLKDCLDKYRSLSSDSEGNIWVIETFLGESTPLFILNKKISSPEDANGVYWVSWKLIPGTKDIYPVLNPE